MTSNIIGATTLEQLESNLGSVELELSEEVLAEIEAGQGVLRHGEVPAFAVCEVTAEPAFTGGKLVEIDAGQLAGLLSKWLGDK